MAIIKLSKSGKQLQFIDEDGNVFVTSANYALRLLNQVCLSDTNRQLNFILLSRLPLKCSKDRFKESPLYDPTGLIEKMKDEYSDRVGTTNDALSQNTIKKLEEKKSFEDKKVW